MSMLKTTLTKTIKNEYIFYPYSVFVQVSKSPSSGCPVLSIPQLEFNQEALSEFIKDLNEVLTYMKENNIG